MPLQVLHVIPFFDPASQFGGPVSLLRELCPRLAALDLRLRVITTDNGLGAEVPRDCWVDRAGYQVWYGRSRWFERRPPYWSPGLQGILRQAISAADVVHASIGLTLLNVQVRQLARRARVPYVYTAQGCLCPTRLRRRRLEKILFLRLFERGVLRGAAALQALTAKENDDYRRQGADADRIHVIPNGVVVNGRARRELGALFRQRRGIPTAAPLVLFLGRLEDVKGIDLLLRAMANVHKRHAKIHLVLAGPDFGFERVARDLVTLLGLQEQVHFTGPVFGVEREAVFGAADLFALTSYSEGLPLAVLEAAALGLPLLITERCHAPEVEYYHAGKVVAATVDAVTSGLEELLDDRDRWPLLGDRARRMAEDCFSIDVVARKLADLYHRLAQR
ncbi:MAG: glycosyltransferase [Gemmataceae bacterium]